MRDRFVQVLVPAVVALAVLVAVRHVNAQVKPPVPAAEVQEPAKKAATEIYGGRFKQAKTAAEKTALAAEMIEAAMKVQDGSPDQYVLLKIAVDIAATAGDAATALQAVEKMAERFDVPGPKLSAETLLAAAGNATMTSQHKAVAEAALKIADAVAGAEEYKLALDLCESAQASAQKARQYPLVKELAAKSDDFQKRQRAFQEYKAAWALMQDDPAQPAANLTAGRYLCLVKGDWDNGVPMLALGSDKALKNVSLMELRGAESAEQQAAIGDAWWDAAETRQGDGTGHAAAARGLVVSAGRIEARRSGGAEDQAANGRNWTSSAGKSRQLCLPPPLRKLQPPRWPRSTKGRPGNIRCCGQDT